MSARLGQNLFIWLTIPKNLRMSPTFCGVLTLKIAFTLCGSARIPSESITYPKNFILVFANSHFYLLRVTPVP